ncbi:zinc finger MYM-type protein 1-like [Aphis craccivora]|uniref:Zinc finger MYM-type protein 1-like n=1 Tax=Aphis craccivora TaxID=307492 RepID=A0A6G0ZPW8_APHCR|nr:zinc finger MYM-type protein 1-like [Aphis craccivora]
MFISKAINKNNNLGEVYPYIDIALRIILYTPATNYSGERSFSPLKRINDERREIEYINYFQYKIRNNKTIIDYKDIIEDFANKPSKKKL